jgi:histidinol-phosphate aminotransferase
MSPSPVSFASPMGPATYTWEATDDEVAARYGVPRERIVRFDLNTSPTPPSLVEGLLAVGRFETSLSEYPPSDYRRLTEAAAARYGVDVDQIVVGAGADEILDLVAKAFLPAGGAAVIPVPTYLMYRVLTEQRGARVIAVPRQGAEAGWALDAGAVRTAARDAQVVWLCSPNNPTALPEPDGSIEALLRGLLADAAGSVREAPIVVLDEAYAEFAGASLLPLRSVYPNLVIVRTASKAYALAGMRVGFAIADRRVIARLNPYRPPGSVSTVSVTVVTEALRDDGILRANLSRVETERARLSAALRLAGWTVGPSVTNFILVDFGSAERSAAVAEELLRRGLVPRTFPGGHVLVGCLRLTIRDPDENDRLINAANEIAARASNAPNDPTTTASTEPPA